MSWHRDNYRHSLAARRISLLSNRSKLIDLKRHSTLDFIGVPTSSQLNLAHKNLGDARKELSRFDETAANIDDESRRAYKKAILRGISEEEARDIQERVYEQGIERDLDISQYNQAHSDHLMAWDDLKKSEEQRRHAKERFDEEILSDPCPQLYRYFDNENKVSLAAIPPAWRNVKHYKNMPYVATGIDKKGRLQYIYPSSFIKKTSEKKYKRINALEKKIPSILGKVKSDISKGKPEAEAVYTIYKTGFRPGTEKDTLADQQAYGVSTLKSKHIKVKGNEVQFKFMGKKGVPVKKEVKDKLLADIMRRRKSEGKQVFPVTDGQMRGYFDKVTNGRYQLKDLRTLRAQKFAKELGGDKKKIAIKVSKELGNTPAVAIKSYVSPELLE